MSFWLYGRKRGGRRYLWQIDTYPSIIVAAVFLLTGMLAPYIMQHLSITGYLAAALLLGGLACLTVAKVSVYRQGIWLSFGPGLMSRGYASLYKAAYALMAVGVLLMFLLLSALRMLG